MADKKKKAGNAGSELSVFGITPEKKKALTANAELPATIVTPDKEYSYFLNSLPDNQRFTPESDYSTRRYWELNGKPRDFDEAKRKGMYTLDPSDGMYHANSIAWGEDGVGYFMKPRHHDTVGYETDWYNKGLSTEPGGVQRPLAGKDREEWERFKDEYDLDMSGEFYRYVPKTKKR